MSGRANSVLYVLAAKRLARRRARLRKRPIEPSGKKRAGGKASACLTFHLWQMEKTRDPGWKAQKIPILDGNLAGKTSKIRNIHLGSREK